MDKNKLMYALESYENDKILSFYKIIKDKKEITAIACMCAIYRNIEMTLHGLNLGANPDDVLINSFERYGDSEPYEIAVASIKAGADEYICLELSLSQSCANLHAYALSLIEKAELDESVNFYGIKKLKSVNNISL